MFFDFLKIMKKYVKSEIVKIIGSFLILQLYSLTSLASPLLTQYLIDVIIVKKQLDLFSHYVIIVIIILAVASVSGWLSNYLLAKCFENISKNMKYDLYLKMNKKDIRFYSKYRSGDISYRIFNDTDIIQNYFYVLLINIPINIITMVIVSAIMIKINLFLTLFVFAVFILQMIFTKIVKSRVVSITFEQREAAQRANGTLVEFIKSIKLILGMGLSTITDKKFNNDLNRQKQINVKSSTLSKGISVIYSVINNVWSLVVLWYGGHLVANNQISLGSLISFIMYANMFYPQINSIFNSLVSFQQVKVSTKRYYEFYNDQAKVFKSIHREASVSSGCIEISDLSFSYYPDQKLISNFSCMFIPNEITVIKGENGSGKTTLCHLIKGFYQNYKGSILIDGIELSEYKTEEIDKSVKYLPQNEFLLSGTIFENLCIDSLEVDEFEMYRALEKVNMRQFVEQLPDKLYSQVGESGVQLSGGQCQRIAFARLLICKPKIIIFDEPTAFVDENSKKLIFNCLKYLKQSSTVIVVMHSSSTENFSDQNIVLS